MSKYLTYHLEDRAMDLIVEHVRKKYAVTEAQAIYGPDQLVQKLRNLNKDLNLYVVGHGACDAPVMMRKTKDNDNLRTDRLRPSVLAEELYKSLPHGQNVNVKLAMCDGATEHTFQVKVEGKEETETMKASFASLTANFLWNMGWENLEHQLDVSKVFIGGAEGAAYWDKDPLNAPRYKHIDSPGLPAMGIPEEYSWERRSRKYFCPAHWSGKLPIDVLKLPEDVKKVKIEETYCYFPFVFDLRKPLELRG